MTGKGRHGGLGKGLGALIPTAPPADFEPHGPEVPATGDAPRTQQATPGSVAKGDITSPSDIYFGARDTRRPDPVSLLDNTGPLPVPGARFAELDVARIMANPKQPRQVFDADALAELTHSVREFGVLQPVVVRERDGEFELVMGERRLRAAQAAGLDRIPAIIRETGDDALLRDALLENIHRAQLNPLEEAAAYQQLLEEFSTTHEELAARLGRSRSQISNTIRLLNLPVPVQRRVAAGVLSAGHARALLGLDDRAQQEELAAKIVAEGLSVRATEELVALASRLGPARPARATGQKITAPGIADLADRLADAFDTRVRVDLGRRKGKITVEFASADDLERIVSLMAPELAVRRTAEG